MALLFLNKVPGDKVAYEAKVREISYKLGIDPNWLQFLIDFESAGSFRASIENTYGCIGLIQFCADTQSVDYKTIGGKKYKLSDLKAMTSVAQLDVVYEYLKQYKGKLTTFYDLYFAILWPAALGKSDSYVISTGTNPVFDLNKNGQILVSEVKQFLNDRANKLVSAEFIDSFFKKKVSGEVSTMEPVKYNVLQIYQREIIFGSIILVLLVILYIVYRQINK